MTRGSLVALAAAVTAGAVTLVVVGRDRSSPKRENPRLLPAPDAVTARIDDLFEQGWRARGLAPSPAATDAALLRRLSLDLRGSIPSESEVRAFLDDSDPKKIETWTERFLVSPEHARYFARLVTDMLVGTEASPGSRPGVLRLWLEEAFRANRPWDALVAELITAQHPREWYGPTNFIIRWSSSPAELAGVTSRVFLGTQIQCAQCHPHPTAPWTRDDFHAFAAFFTDLKRRPTNIKKIGLSDAMGGLSLSLVTVSGQEMRFDPESGEYSIAAIESQARDAGAGAPEPEAVGHEPPIASSPDDPSRLSMIGKPAEIPMSSEPVPAMDGAPPAARDAIAPEEVASSPRVIQPRFLGGKPIDDVEGKNRRQALSELVLTEGRRALARTFVNRVVAWLFGRGLVHPVDDFTASNPPSHPEILDLLTDDFIDSGFDVRRTFRILLGTRAFRLSSAPTPGSAADPGGGFSRISIRQLNGHQLFDSVLQATGVPIPDDPAASDLYATFDRLIAAWRAHGSGPLSRPAELLFAIDPEQRARMMAAGFDLPLGLLDPTGLDPREVLRVAFLRKLRGDDPQPEGSEACQRTIQQALLVMNGELIHDSLKARVAPPGSSTLVDRLSSGKTSARQKVETAFLATLGRLPSDGEASAALATLEVAKHEREAIEDLLWALLDSAEFLHEM